MFQPFHPNTASYSAPLLEPELAAGGAAGATGVAGVADVVGTGAVELSGVASTFVVLFDAESLDCARAAGMQATLISPSPMHPRAPARSIAARLLDWSSTGGLSGCFDFIFCLRELNFSCLREAFDSRLYGPVSQWLAP